MADVIKSFLKRPILPTMLLICMMKIDLKSNNKYLKWLLEFEKPYTVSLFRLNCYFSVTSTLLMPVQIKHALGNKSTKNLMSSKTVSS